MTFNYPGFIFGRHGLTGTMQWPVCGNQRSAHYREGCSCPDAFRKDSYHMLPEIDVESINAA
jgi:hypothetical protein